MNTIGNIISKARQEKNISVLSLSQKTKIKEEFIKNLENEKWDQLPDYAVICGFVKNISDELSLNREQTMAFLRRDYPPSLKSKSVAPKPDLEKENFRIGPKFVFVVLSLLILLIFGSYLFYQYKKFTKSPFLEVNNIKDNMEIKAGNFTVVGITDKNATILVNNQPALIDENGNFATEILINEETDKIEVISKKRNGSQTVVSKNIKIVK